MPGPEQEWDGTEPLPAKPFTDEERAEYDKRARELTELAEELGLYDVPAEEYVSALEQARYSLPVTADVCPYCGALLPCAAHRAGG